MAKDTIQFEVVSTSEVPTITRSNNSSKYRPIVDAAIENEGQAIKVPFADNKTAHSRAGSVRTITTKHEEADRFNVVVRGSDIYVTFGDDGAAEEGDEIAEGPEEDETEEVTETPAPKKKATRKRTAARKRA